MPDLTIQYVQVCSRETFSEDVASSKGTEMYHVQVSPDESLDRCTCPGFTYRGRCKHVTAARGKICQWSEDESPETQTPQQEMEGICPKCGGETKVIKIAS